MSVSIKVEITGHGPRVLAALGGHPAFYVRDDGKAIAETDAYYEFDTPAAPFNLVKHRLPEGALIFQSTASHGEMNVRNNRVMVTYPRGLSRDAEPEDVFGPSRFSLSRSRVYFDLKRKNFQGFAYMDTIPAWGEASFLEIQIHPELPSQAQQAEQEIKRLLEEIGLDDHPQIVAPYFALRTRRGRRSPLTDAILKMWSVESSIRTYLLGGPVLQMGQGGTIFTKGDSGDHALFVVRGEAYATDARVTMGPGSLCGEFAIMTNGPRTDTVVAGKNFAAVVIPRGDVLRFLPYRFGDKFRNWSLTPKI